MSSKRHQRRRSCEDKFAHATWDDACREAARLRRLAGAGTWHAYHCPWCNRFHVGRPNNRQRQASKARRAAEQ